MAILVTGGGGYIGSHMTWRLTDAGEDVVVLDNLSTGFRWAVAPEARLVEGDVGDTELVRRLIGEHGIEAIIHFAGSIVVPDSVTDPLGYYLNNTVKSRALIEAAVKGGVKHFIFSSSAAVYGNPDAVPVDETALPNPLSPYGRSKLMSEQMLADSGAAYGLRYVALRYFNVAGADPHGRLGQSTPGATHLIKVAIETALGHRSHMNIFGSDYATPDGTCVRDYVHVSDLARAHLSALDHLRQGGTSKILNCGYGRGYSVREVVHAVRMVAGTDFEVRYAPRRPGDPASVVADSKQFFRLGWKPQLTDLPTMIEHAYRWEEILAAKRQSRAAFRAETEKPVATLQTNGFGL